MARVSAAWRTTRCAFWNAWHHHMALVMMAMLFLLTERLRMKDQCPLLSCADIEKLLAAFLPRRDASPEQVYTHMKRLSRNAKTSDRIPRQTQRAAAI